jgi:glycerophosphoryl diester phosphodiesterase
MVPPDVAAAHGGLTFGEMTSAEGLHDMASYADVVAPEVRGVIPLGADGKLGAVDPIVANAHAAGLQVVIWTFRPENMFLAGDFRNGASAGTRNPAGSIAEIKRYIVTGIDGFFTDDPALGRAAADAI